MATFWRRRGRPPHPEILTPSEQRVLELIRQGKTNSEIAYELSISIPGVKWHVSNMLGKLGLADRHELAAWDGRMTGAAAGHSSGKRAGTAGVAGWLGWKAAVGAGAGLAVAGIVVAAALSHSSAESPAAVIATPAPPQPPALFTASVDFADALSTKVRLELQLASPPTTEYMLSIENGFAIYADGDRSRDYAPTMRLLEGGPNTGNSGIFAIEFDPVPADTQFLEVVLNGTLRKVAMSQAESDRQKTQGAELFQAVPPGTTARAALARDPLEVDLTDEAPKEFDSGLGWKYVFERVIATSTRLGVTYRVDGIAGGPYHDLGRRIPHSGDLQFWDGPDTSVTALPPDGSPAIFGVGPRSRWVAEPIRATFTRQSTGAWTDWAGNAEVGRFSATFTDAPAVVLQGPPGAVLLGAPTKMSDDLGHTYRQSGSYGGPAALELKFEGPLDSAANAVTLQIDGYWVPETQEWTVEIPVR